jgi:signal transduction histidine kinase
VGKGWKIVDKNQNKISSLVMDMLSFSKEREPDLTTANINTVVHDVLELMQSRAQEEQVELCFQAAENMPELVFDPEGIHRAVLNIVTNAVDAVAEAGPPGRVTVKTCYLPEQNVAQIEIRDTGPGIAADQMDKLFSPFVSTKKSRGTGLGLPVSQKILTEHGGKITVESLPGQGACFTLELPAVSPGSLTHVGEPPTG